ncbi:MAG: class II aldolase/adducin family protein [Desulfobacterales bacterium]
MSRSTDITALRHQFQVVGAALMRADLNNTHSGNLSLCDPSEPDRFYITASGSMCGALCPEEVVPVRFSDTGWSGARRPSSETNTHRAVLSLPGVRACAHCHATAATLISLESPEKPLFLTAPAGSRAAETAPLFQPVDFFGAGLLGAVSVGAYAQAVGSRDMEERIPDRLRQSPLTIVKGHGPFARGAGLAECLHYLSLLENSARLALALRRRGVDLGATQRLILENGFGKLFPGRPRVPEFSAATRPDRRDPTGTELFAYFLGYNFDLGLGAFAAGSMSIRQGPDEMLFCPMAAAPAGLEAPVHRLPVGGSEPHAADIRLHRSIYTSTPYTACVIAPSPRATAEAVAVLSEAVGTDASSALAQRGPERAAELPVIVPIDAEASYYNVRLPVAPPAAIGDAAPVGLIPEMLRRGNGCGIVAGCGVIAAGEEGLAQAVYRLSLAERIARFRQEAHLNHLLLGGFRPF